MELDPVRQEYKYKEYQIKMMQTEDLHDCKVRRAGKTRH